MFITRTILATEVTANCYNKTTKEVTQMKRVINGRISERMIKKSFDDDNTKFIEVIDKKEINKKCRVSIEDFIEMSEKAEYNKKDGE